jgi:dihydropteroate synthase
VPDPVLDRLATALAGQGPAAAFWLRPLAAISGPAARAAITDARAVPLAGGAPLAFSQVEVVIRDTGSEAGMTGAIASIADARSWAVSHGWAARFDALLKALAAPRASWAGIDFTRPRIMAIVNVTPDSFSDGGDHLDAAAAVAYGKAALAAGADILDIGGESTRPGSLPVDPAEEIRRIEPVIRELANAGAPVSVDTRHGTTMRAALAAGARIINDVTALTADPRSLAVAAETQAPVVLMHMRGEPRTMQDDPVYACAPLDVLDYLEERIEACVAGGIPRSRIVVDPGIGFGKRLRHNLQILAHLSLLHLTGCPILLGASRKSFISSTVSRGEPPKDRLAGSLAAELGALDQGVQILRVHDIAETCQAVEVWRGIRQAG